MPQIEITLDDLRAILAMAEITVLARGRKILPLTEPLAQKIEKYLEDLAKAEKAVPAEAPKPSPAEAESPATNEAVADKSE